MLGRVRAPRPPWFSALKQTARRWPRHLDHARGTKQNGVSGGKGVRLTEGAQGEVLCRPLADATNRAKPRDRGFDRTEGAKQVGISEGGTCQGRHDRSEE